MTKAELRNYESKLVGWRQTLREQLPPNEEPELVDDSDPIARQSAEMAGSLDHLWRHALFAQSREIDAAVERTRDGSFGYCEQCGDPISSKRLEVIPWARKCFPCQSSAPESRASLATYSMAVGSRWSSSS